jgi:hypothetical protein
MLSMILIGVPVAKTESAERISLSGVLMYTETALTFRDSNYHISQADILRIDWNSSPIITHFLVLDNRTNPQSVFVNIDARDKLIGGNGSLVNPCAVWLFSDQLLADHVAVVESGLDGDELESRGGFASSVFLDPGLAFDCTIKRKLSLMGTSAAINRYIQ